MSDPRAFTARGFFFYLFSGKSDEKEESSMAYKDMLDEAFAE
jgi:hypothetical protein